ncbi:MAG: DUF4129 domain-containing protein [Chloroflexota bacterium]
MIPTGRLLMRSNAWPEYAAALLAASMLEAAWITLVYVLVESLTGPAEAPLSMLAFAAAAVAGLGFARWSMLGRRRPYQTPLAGIAVALALVGWLLPLGNVAADVVNDPTLVFGMHPGGILLGLAFLRGTAHTTRVADERIAEVALGPGLAAVAGLWLLLTVTGGTGEAWVVGAASSASVTYVTAGLLSIGLARLAELRGAGVRGAERRIWDGVLFGVVAGLLFVALPLAMIIGVPLGGVLSGGAEVVTQVLLVVATPFIWAGALVGMVLFLVIEFLRTVAGGTSAVPGTVIGGPLVDWQGMLGSAGQNGLALGVAPLVIAIVIAFVLVRMLARRPRRSVVDGEVVEVREPERPIGMRLHRPRLARPKRQLVPRTASEAYVASIELLARWPDSARHASETPAEHARRLGADAIGPSLRRLAADYALAEFGKRTLGPSEHRRAIERWRRLRSSRGR